MTAPLRGPHDRYQITLEIACPDQGQPRRRRVTTGEPMGDAGAPGWRILADDACSLLLIAGDSGLTVRDLTLQAPAATITAVVTAAAAAPDWLPAESRYLLFQGDRQDAQGFTERYLPLDGLTTPSAPPAPSLEQVAVAVGRAIARANSRLSRGTSPGGTALVTSVTIRMALAQTDLQGGRISVAPSGGGRTGTAPPSSDDGAGQFVEFTLTAVPSSQDEGIDTGGSMTSNGAAMTPGAADASDPAPTAPMPPRTGNATMRTPVRATVRPGSRARLVYNDPRTQNGGPPD